MYTEMQQQCDTEAAAVMALDAEKMRMSLIPQTDSEYARSNAFIHSLTSTMGGDTLWAAAPEIATLY